MAERKIKLIELEIPKPEHRLAKRWKVLSLMPNQGNLKDRNGTVEWYYETILQIAKKCSAELPDEYSKTVFERDYRHDHSAGCMIMHSFITPNFYWELECDFAYFYQLEYNFYNCPFEEEVRRIFKGMRSVTPKHRPLKPDADAYFRRVIAVQDKQYIHLL